MFFLRTLNKQFFKACQTLSLLICYYIIHSILDNQAKAWVNLPIFE